VEKRQKGRCASMESHVITMLVVSLCLAAVIIYKKDTIPAHVRRPLALVTIVLVLASFIMMVASFLQM
jgi:DMSO/TMAO reductase YedYZ heme-binding membrane subunit